MAASVLRPLKKLGYMTEVISSKPNHVVYLNNPHVDKLSIKDPDKDLPQGNMDLWQAWFDSRAKEYDLFLHASHACEGRHAIFPSMTAFWWPVEYRRKLCAGNYLETLHDIIGVPHEFGPLYYATDEEKANAAQVKRSVGPHWLVWVISGTRIDKMYPYATMAIGRIIKEVGIPVVVMGGPSDKETSAVQAIRDSVAIQNGTRDGLHTCVPNPGDLEKCWPLRTSLAIAQSADILVTPDTGPWWACAFEDMPKILMVSHASVENIAKHAKNTIALHANPDRVPCWSCHRLHNDPSTCVVNREGNGAACISDISVELLVTAVKAVNGSQSSVDKMLKNWASNVTLSPDLVHAGMRQNVIPLQAIAANARNLG